MNSETRGIKMSIYQTICEQAHEIFSNPKNVYITPEIPSKKIDGAIKGIAKNINPEDIIMIYDSTIFGGSDEGYVFTADRIYYNDSNAWNISYSDVENIDFEENVVKDKKGKEKIEQFIIINLKDNSSIKVNDYYIKMKEFKSFIESLCKEFNLANKVENVKNTPLEEQVSNVKLAYIKIIVNFTYSDDNSIDSRELQDIYSLMERIKMTEEQRLDIIKYSNQPDESTDDLIKTIFDNINEVTKKNVSPSLLKDLVFIQICTKKAHYEDSSFIMELAKKLSISKDGMDIIKKSIENDRKIFNREVDDKGLADGFSNILAGSASVGIPIAALYFSGSIIGLGATGITSGLAALGFGGVLGFSSMATGLGVLLLVGFGVNKGVKYLTGSDEIEARKKKEAMLIDVAKHQQRTIDLIISDIKKIIEEIEKVFNRTIDLENNLVEKDIKLKELMHQIKMIISTAKYTAKNHTITKNCIVQTKLPTILDLNRLKVITNTPTKQRYYQIVLNCYICEETVIKNGNKIEKKTNYLLRDDLSLEQSDQLLNLLNVLNYFSASSAIKGLLK